MYFYKDVNGLFRIGNTIVPPRTCMLKMHDDGESITVLSPDKIPVTPGISVTKFQREDDSFYPDVITLLSENADFFK